jgi:hypothetical protein
VVEITRKFVSARTLWHSSVIDLRDWRLGRRPKVLSAVAVFTALLLVVSFASACSSRSASERNFKLGSGVAVASSSLPAHAHASVATTPATAIPTGLTSISPEYELTPTGPLSAPAIVRLPLTARLGADEGVLIAWEETSAGPWRYLPATGSSGASSVEFTTTHFSIFSALGFDLGAAAAQFKSFFLNEVDGGATTSVAQPTCSDQAQARADGYSIASSATDTVYWCFGESGGHRVLEVTNHRRYPLEVTHPRLSVIDRGQIDLAQLSSLSHLGSGSYTILGPGDEATFSVDLSPGQVGGIQTQMDGLGQSLYALQTGVDTALELLSKFGFRSTGSSSLNALNSMVGDSQCAASLGDGVGALLAGCFNPKQLLKTFGAKATILIPLMVFGPIVAFFHSEWNALVDQFNHHDEYTIRIVDNQSAAPSTAPPPTTPTTAPTTTPPTAAAPSFAVGAPFNDDCVIAWPTAPSYTSNSIEMTMSCDHVPEGQYLFTDVIYDDPSLQPTPDSGTMHVVGTVVDVARSDYGYSELVVQASHVTILGSRG